jgi:class 3 adenylate cyclase/tetratricopeptide (TPR) repeat protein
MRSGSPALATERVERRLAAILAADVAGFGRLLRVDEEGALARLKAHRRNLIDPKITAHRGRIVNTAGDGLVVEFSSVVEAVRCAAEVQRCMADRDAEMDEGGRIEFRMGINLGDIISDGNDIFGEGVDVAFRLEALAEPGGLCISRVVRDQIRDKLPYAFEDIGEQSFKNIARPMRVYALSAGALASLPPVPNMPKGDKRMRTTRRLAAILAADIAGYSRLIGADEGGTLQAFKTIRAELFDPTIAEHNGRLVKTTGDGFLVEFSSVVDALRCATDVQTHMAERNSTVLTDRRIEFRIGINVGDIVVEDGDIFGDGVNVAARLEALAEPGGICISGRVQEDVAGKLDLAFEDIGEQQLKNIARSVRVYRVAVERHAEAETEPSQLALPDKPSIAVLPFANMSGDPEQEYFADGMVEEIITALSRIRWLFVIARNSSFTYKGQAVDVKQVGGELGVRYVLEGSVRKAGTRVRITGQLIDALTGTQLWADRFDGSLEDVFELQDQVAVSVAGVIEPALRAAEIRRSAARPTTDLSSYDLLLRALAVFFPMAKERVIQALGLLDQAIAIDPHYGPALSMVAICHMHLVINGWVEEPETCSRKAIELARRALEAGGNDPGVLAGAAFVLAYFGEDIGAMIGLVDRALALSPSYARGWYLSGVLRLWAGQPDLAIEHIETSLRLSPRERMGMAQPLFVTGTAYFFKRQFDEAATKLLLSIQDHPGFPAQYRFLAACYAHMGRLDEARAIVARLRAIAPRVMPSDMPLRNPENRELFLSGLRLAAGEAT